jgi:hypothetical protein
MHRSFRERFQRTMACHAMVVRPAADHPYRASGGLALWLLAGYHVTLRMRQAQRDAAQDVLSAIRAQVLVSSVVVRDTFLDPDSALATSQRLENERAPMTR